MKNVAFLVRVSLAVSEKYPQTKTTPNYSVLQNVQPSDDITPLTQQAYYHLLLLVGYIHWTLDVTFSEDACGVRTGHAPQNLALLRRIAL